MSWHGLRDAHATRAADADKTGLDGRTRRNPGRAQPHARRHSRSRLQLLTIGQYLRPTREQIEVERYVEPAEFAEIEAEARALGFAEVPPARLVRSSYRADRSTDHESAGHEGATRRFAR